MKISEIEPKTFSRLAAACEVALWIILGLTAMLWWLPARLGEKNGVPQTQAALFLAFLWIWVFNYWPQLGTRKFFRQNGFFKVKLVLLVIISAGFAYGVFSST